MWTTFWPDLLVAVIGASLTVFIALATFVMQRRRAEDGLLRSLISIFTIAEPLHLYRSNGSGTIHRTTRQLLWVAHPSFAPDPWFREGLFTGTSKGPQMAEQIPIQANPENEPRERTADTSQLHLVSGEDAIEAGRDDQLDAILARGDIRDQAAERRDRRADRRPRAAGDSQAQVDREWAGRDRDAAACDRADLVELLHEKQGMVLVIDKARGILMARRGCSPKEAFSLLSNAARQNALTVEELTDCLVAELHLR